MSVEMNWISVDNRLPKTFEVVLAAGLRDDGHQFVVKAYLNDNPPLWINCEGGAFGGPSGSRVTHWMPMPQLPAIGN